MTEILRYSRAELMGGVTIKIEPPAADVTISTTDLQLGECLEINGIIALSTIRRSRACSGLN